MNGIVKAVFWGAAAAAAMIPGAALACSCAYGGSFLKVASDASLVLRGTVVSHDKEKPERPLFMMFQISDVLAGSYSPGPIRIWGDNGAQCRPNIKQFPVGSEWILAVHGPEGKPSGTGEHYLSNCGQYWLGVDGAYVLGNVSSATQNTKQRVSIVEFRRQLKKAGL